MYKKNDNELYAEKWFEDHGFNFKLIKQYISKTKYKVEKSGVSDDFELLSNVIDIKKYMDMFEKSFKMKIEIAELKSKLQ